MSANQYAPEVFHTVVPSLVVRGMLPTTPLMSS